MPSGMRQYLGTPLGRRIHELTAFTVVGGVCFVIDVAVFQLLYGSLGVDAVLTKLLATTVSMTAAFLGHRFWSFKGRARTGLRREYARFTGINGLTLLLGLGIVGFVRYALGQESVLVLQAANVVSIVVGTVVRYLCYRRWVFPAAQGSSAPQEGRRAGGAAVAPSSRTPHAPPLSQASPTEGNYPVPRGTVPGAARPRER